MPPSPRSWQGASLLREAERGISLAGRRQRAEQEHGAASAPAVLSVDTGHGLQQKMLSRAVTDPRAELWQDTHKTVAAAAVVMFKHTGYRPTGTHTVVQLPPLSPQSSPASPAETLAPPDTSFPSPAPGAHPPPFCPCEPGPRGPRRSGITRCPPFRAPSSLERHVLSRPIRAGAGGRASVLFQAGLWCTVCTDRILTPPSYPTTSGHPGGFYPLAPASKAAVAKAHRCRPRPRLQCSGAQSQEQSCRAVCLHKAALKKPVRVSAGASQRPPLRRCFWDSGFVRKALLCHKRSYVIGQIAFLVRATRKLRFSNAISPNGQ